MDTVSIDPRKLHSRIGSPLVLDVRRDKAFAEGDHEKHGWNASA